MSRPKKLATPQLKIQLFGAHRREQLAALFWGDSTDKEARTSLRVAMTALYKAVGRERFEGDYDAVELVADETVWVDVRAFEAAAMQFLAQAHVDTASPAFELYRGDLLSDGYDDWVLRERERLRALYLRCLERLAAHWRAQSEYARAIESAQKLLVHDPAHEPAHQHLMFCLMATGNRNAALAQYAECERALREELGATPSKETRALYEKIRAQAATDAPAARLTNVPIPATSFIGRQHERTEIQQRLDHARLVTLTGAGGSGKTRLAIQVGTELAGAFRDGVWWVELAPLADGEMVLAQIAHALGIREQAPQPLRETVNETLATRALLLILDNCEHVIDAVAAHAAALLAACPHIKILATSREPLNIPGEETLPLATLNVPRAYTTSFATLVFEFDAVRLFVERAHAANPHFELTNENTSAVLQICQRLDGIPLALELAAARVRGMSVQELAAKLDDRFQWLIGGSRIAPPRQQTLRALIDWSYDLLSEAERVLFARASVFAGGWTMDALEEIAAAENLPRREIATVLFRLIERSLVIADVSQTETRYTMLETMREYAREKLNAAGETALVRARHLEHYCHWLKQVEPHLWEQASIIWMKRIQQDNDNLRAALDYGLETNQARGVELAVWMKRFWVLSNYYHEAQARLSAFIARDAEPNSLLHGQALSALGHMEFRLCQYAQAVATSERALALVETFHDTRTQAETLRTLELSTYALKQYARALEYQKQAYARFAELDDKYGQGVVLNDRGDLERTLGNFEQAEAFYREALGYFQTLGERRACIIIGSNVALAMSARGAYAEALEILCAHAPQFLEIQEQLMLVYVLSEIAFIRGRLGDAVRAIHLFSATEALRLKLNFILLGDDQTLYDQRLAEMKTLAASEEFERAWTAGQTLTPEQAIALAIEPT